MNAPRKDDAVTLEILNAIDREAHLSQRNLAGQLGVALGLANSYVRKCVKKGLVKIKQAPANRYAYYLTPKGFTEKSRLTAEFLHASFDLYRRASEAYREVFAVCEQRAWRRVLLLGQSELGEIAVLRARDFDVAIIGTYEPDAADPTALGVPVFNDLDQIGPFDAALLTALPDTARVYADARRVIDEDRIFVPALLRAMIPPAPAGVQRAGGTAS